MIRRNTNNGRQCGESQPMSSDYHISEMECDCGKTGEGVIINNN